MVPVGSVQLQIGALLERVVPGESDRRDGGLCRFHKSLVQCVDASSFVRATPLSPLGKHDDLCSLFASEFCQFNGAVERVLIAAARAVLERLEHNEVPWAGFNCRACRAELGVIDQESAPGGCAAENLLIRVHACEQSAEDLWQITDAAMAVPDQQHADIGPADLRGGQAVRGDSCLGIDTSRSSF